LLFPAKRFPCLQGTAAAPLSLSWRIFSIRLELLGAQHGANYLEMRFSFRCVTAQKHQCKRAGEILAWSAAGAG